MICSMKWFHLNPEVLLIAYIPSLCKIEIFSWIVQELFLCHEERKEGKTWFYTLITDCNRFRMNCVRRLWLCHLSEVMCLKKVWTSAHPWLTDRTFRGCTFLITMLLYDLLAKIPFTCGVIQTGVPQLSQSVFLPLSRPVWIMMLPSNSENHIFTKINETG